MVRQQYVKTPRSLTKLSEQHLQRNATAVPNDESGSLPLQINKNTRSQLCLQYCIYV